MSVEGEVGGAPFEGDQKLEAGMGALELSQLMEIATERPCRIVGDAVGRLRRGESRIGLRWDRRWSSGRWLQIPAHS